MGERLYTSSGQHTKPDPVVWEAGELARGSRAGPTHPHLPCGGIDEGKMPSPLDPLLAAAGKRAGTRFTKGLTLPLTSCSTLENRPCILPGQHTRAGLVAKAQVSYL